MNGWSRSSIVGVTLAWGQLKELIGTVSDGRFLRAADSRYSKISCPLLGSNLNGCKVSADNEALAPSRTGAIKVLGLLRSV
jgi:hypothetical protein